MVELNEKPVSQETVDRVANLQHAAKIADAMAPDPREWAYNGKCYEVEGLILEKCACGHAIRQVFVVERERDGKQINIGSTCIETTVPYLISAGAEGLAKALQAALVALQEEIRAKAKQRRDAEASEAVQRVAEEYVKLHTWAKELRRSMVDRNEYLPSVLYGGLCGLPSASTTPARTAAAIRTRYESLWLELMAAHVAGYLAMVRGNDVTRHLPKPPVPVEEKLVQKIAKTLRGRIETYSVPTPSYYSEGYYEKRLALNKAALETLQAA